MCVDRDKNMSKVTAKRQEAGNAKNPFTHEQSISTAFLMHFSAAILMRFHAFKKWF